MRKLCTFLYFSLFYLYNASISAKEDDRRRSSTGKGDNPMVADAAARSGNDSPITSKSMNKNRRNAHSTSNAATLHLPLLAHSGTHHLQIYVGQPPVKRTLIVDTGSRLTAWTCQPCSSCGKGRVHYDPSRSMTSSLALYSAKILTANQCDPSICHFAPISTCSRDRKKCILEQRYTEGSTWEAYEVTDFITLGGVRPLGIPGNTSLEDDYETSLPYATIPFTFGCQTKLTGLFKEQFADGILGLEHSNFSLLTALYSNHILEEFMNVNFEEAPFEAMERDLLVPQDPPEIAFSICLSPEGGWMGLGGALINRHLKPMRNTPLVRTTNSPKAKGMYSVIVSEVWMGDKCLTCHSKLKVEILESFSLDKGTILDTGTTDTYLPERMGDTWKDEWFAQTGRSLENDTDYFTETELLRLPTIRIVLRHNVSLIIPPSHYMEPVDEKRHYQSQQARKLWSNRIYLEESQGAVLGINSMLGHDILFDWGKGIVGIAQADCINASPDLSKD